MYKGEVEEDELFALLDDPAAEPMPRFFALGALARVHGDDARAATLFRSILAEVGYPDSRNVELQTACLAGLARRDRSNAVEVLNAGLTSRSPHVRFAAINGLTFIGDTSHYEEMLALLTRAVKKGQGKAGGFFTDRLAQYVFSCLRQGTGDFDSFKALIRDSLSRMPEEMQSLFRRFLPGIENDNLPLDQISLPMPE